MPAHVYLPYLAVAWFAYFIAVVSPGPATMALIGTSMHQGRKSGIAFALGVLTGSFVWANLTALGVAAILATYAHLLFAIKIVGGLYLLWMAWKAFRAASVRGDVPMGHGKSGSLKTLYFKGLALHLTNPKAILAWISLMTLGMPHGAPTSVIAIYIAGCVVIGWVTFIGLAVLFSTAPVLSVYRRARRGIEATMGVFFTFAGLKLLTARI